MKEKYKIRDIEKELKRIIKTKSYTLRFFCRPPKKLPKSFYNDMKKYFDEIITEKDGVVLDFEDWYHIKLDHKNFDKEKFYDIIYHYCKCILGIYPKGKPYNQDASNMIKITKHLIYNNIRSKND